MDPEIENVTNTTIFIVILIVCVLVIASSGMLTLSFYLTEKENYKTIHGSYGANDIDDAMDVQKAIKPKHVGELDDKNTTNYIKTSDFNKLVANIKILIVDEIIKKGKVCQDLNGSEVGFGDECQHMTLSCITDPFSLEEEIALKIAKMIIDNVKKEFNINLSPYAVLTDIMRHLNLLEGVIYPLQYTKLYTVHRINYFNSRMVFRMVNDNVDVKNVLYNILSRRGIELYPNNDQHFF